MIYIYISIDMGYGSPFKTQLLGWNGAVPLAAACRRTADSILHPLWWRLGRGLPGGCHHNGNNATGGTRKLWMNLGNCCSSGQKSSIDGSLCIHQFHNLSQNFAINVLVRSLRWSPESFIKTKPVDDFGENCCSSSQKSSCFRRFGKEGF